VYIYT